MQPVSLASILALGFFLGMRHATDADHVVAVTAIVSRERSARAAAAIGALWGVGHSATLILVGGALVVFRFVIPPHLGLSMEMAVALVLILLGGMNVSDAFHRIEHAARGSAERDERTSVPGAAARSARVARPLVVGIVHGLAGSAAIALLVLTTIRDLASSLGYLLVFGAGTIGGMTLLTAMMAMPLAAASRRFSSLDRTMARATGFLSIAFGSYLCYRVGFVDGLFSAHPRWTPY